MKVKFELSEDNRLKAYYLFQLRKRLSYTDSLSNVPFDVFLNKFALEQFVIGLDDDIASLEERIFNVDA